MQDPKLANQLMQAMALRGGQQGQQAPQQGQGMPMPPPQQAQAPMSPQGMPTPPTQPMPPQQAQQAMQNMPAGQQAMLQKMMGG